MTDSSPCRKKKKLTIAASKKGVETAEKALIRLGFGSKSNFARSKRLSRSTVTKFFTQSPIVYDSFKGICDSLQLKWEEILETPGENINSQPIERQLNPSSDIEEGVKKKMLVRQVNIVENISQTTKTVITLKGDINSISNIQVIAAILKEHGGDTIQITDIQEGSIKLIIEGSQEDIDRLLIKIQSGELTELDGFPVEDAQILAEKVPEEIEVLDLERKTSNPRFTSSYELYDIPSELGSKNFVGRDEEMQQLHGLLQDGSRVAIAAVSGMGGIGKTELAWQYANFHREHNTYPAGIWWLFVRDNDLAPQVLQKALRMGIQPPDTLDNLEERLQFCYEEWAKQTSGNALLVLDDVNDYPAVQPLLPRNPRFKVLLTARQIVPPPVGCLPLKVLKPEAALNLLRLTAGDLPGSGLGRIDAQLEDAQALCQWLDYLPLGIELVGRYLRRKRVLSLAEMLQRLQSQRLEARALQEAEAGMTARRGVAAAFELSWAELKPPARTLGCLLSVFALAPIPWELVAECLPGWDEEELEDCRDYELLEQSLLSLVEDETSDSGQSGLVQPRYQLHALIREFFAAKLQGHADAEILRSNFAVTLIAVAKTIPQTVTLKVQERVKEALPHLEVVAEQWSHLLEDNDAVWSFTSLARVAQGQSLWVEAEKWFKACLQMTQQRCGTHHPGTATSLNNLAELYRAMGRYAEAEPLLVRSLWIWEQQLGSDHPQTALSLNNLATLYYAMERYPEAEALYVRSLSIYEQQPGADHPNTAATLNNLAELYRAMRRYSEAEPLLVRSLAIIEQQVGAEHPQTAMSLNNLATLYYATGRYAEAEPLLVRSLAIWEQQLGTDHPHTAQSLYNLAELYRAMRRYSEAEPLLVRSLSIYEQQLGADHPDTASSLNSLAGLYKSMGRYAEAEPFYVRALSIYERHLGADHPDTATSLNNLAALYYAMGRYPKAELLFLRTSEIRFNRLGDNHPDTQTVWSNFIYFLQQPISTGQDSQLSQYPTTQAILQQLRETE
jgi:tetratricopeptide (TPR) repeat protein